MKNDYLIVSPHVQEAIDNKQPVIAIETAGIFLGLTGAGETMDGIGTDGVRRNEGARPDYFSIQESVEKLVTDNGAVPALVAVIDGKIHVGLSSDEHKLLDEKQGELARVSQSSLPLVLAMPTTGVMTVSATMKAAQMAGISVVVSFAIGGVSMEYDNTQKISADLYEIVHNRMVVVATGINAGSDPVRTLEYLETHGVPVVGFRTDRFYTRWLPKQEHPLPMRVDDPSDIAATLAVKRSLDLTGSVLVFNPTEEDLTDADRYDAEKNRAFLSEVINDNVTVAAWIAKAVSMDLDPNIQNKNSKRASLPKKEKSMSFEVWLFAVKKFAQNYDVALLIFNNLPDSEKERLRQEYEDSDL